MKLLIIVVIWYGNMDLFIKKYVLRYRVWIKIQLLEDVFKTSGLNTVFLIPRLTVLLKVTVRAHYM